jgi:hypothetical protein
MGSSNVAGFVCDSELANSIELDRQCRALDTKNFSPFGKNRDMALKMRHATATRKINARKMKAHVVNLHAPFREINGIIRGPFVGMEKIPLSS